MFVDDKIKYFFPKVRNRLPIYITKFYEFLPVEKLSILGIDTISGKEDLINKLEKMLGTDLPDIICNAGMEEQNLILYHANDAKHHIFNVLGSGPKKMESINWSREIKSGFEWPVGVFYQKIRGLTPKGSDIKIPWEISRSHHILWMSEAYCLTSDESYAEEVINQIEHWIQHNPLMYSVNWTCAMDVAIRAINWMYSLTLISSSRYFTDEFAVEVYHSLYQHLFFINHNLEKCIPYSNNHYFSDIVGQLFLSQLFFSTRRGKKTLKHAIKEFCHEIQLQFLPSGVNYERSISYHRLMSELALFSYYMLLRTGHKLPECLPEKLSKILGYINQYIMKNGCSPLVSDNDDGRLLPLVPVSFMKHGYLIESNSIESRVASFGCQCLSIAYENNKSCIHHDANLAILKKDGMYLYISCFHRWRYDKLTGKYISTHLHNDLLSFVWADGDTPIIVDPGAYCYTSDIQTWKSFRTAKKHNTIVVDNEEPNLLGNSVFMMKYNSNAKSLFLSSQEIEHCEGEYTTIEGGMNHHRDFELSSLGIRVIDKLRKKGENHSVYMSFHFAEDIDVKIVGRLIYLTSKEKEYLMSFESELLLSLHLIDDTISPSFGVLKKSKTLVVEFRFDENAECTTIINKVGG